MINAIHGIVASAADLDAVRFLAAAQISDTLIRSTVQSLVLELKAAALWQKIKALWPMVGGTAFTHQWNLKDPRDADSAFRLVFTGTPTHSSIGVDFNGDTANSFFIAANQLIYNSLHLAWYSGENNANGGRYFTAYDGVNSGVAVQFLVTGNLFYFDSYATTGSATSRVTASATTNPTTRLLLANRPDGNTKSIYRDGVAIGTTTGTGGAQPLVPFVLGGTVTDCRFASIGDGFSSAEITTFNTIVQNFQTRLNRQI